MITLELYSLVCSYDHPDIISGQGTAGLEIIEQVDNIDAVIIPVGGGGLIAGAAVAIKTLNPSIKIIVSNTTTGLLLYINITSGFSTCLSRRT